ncbi:MAG TPA: SPFH domain-containing protein [Anaerolineae bacterium]|nr:SPFH domain-containing protein [Anaerolineae bacterium]
MSSNNSLARRARAIGTGIVGLFFLLFVIFILSFFGNFFYFFNAVQEQEIGVKIQGARIEEIVSPGLYSDVGLFVSLETVRVSAIAFDVTDPEIITADKQRIGLNVTGDIFRTQDKVRIRELWSNYRTLFLDDTAARTRIESFARQAMKVCVGDRTFDDNIIGTARDALRACIDDEVNELASAVGMTVENLVVPEVVLSPEVQVALDAIVQSRLETEKAAQDALKAEAEASAEQARQEGEIRVEQSRIQEQTRQQTALAELERERLSVQTAVIEAQRANDLAQLETERQVIEATKNNELLSAEKDLEISAVLAEAAVARAQASLAEQTVLAALYQDYPNLLQLRLLEANASALNSTDKVIFTTEGTAPTIVVPGPGIVPTVETGTNTTTVTTP